MTKNAIHWFEIAVINLDRAARFYESALGISLDREIFQGTPMAVFPADRPSGVAGALVIDERLTPAGNNTLAYLDAGGKLDAILERIPRLGGRVVRPKTAIGPAGLIAVFEDTEGNLVGLHSEP